MTSTLWKTLLGLWIVSMLSVAAFARAQDDDASGDDDGDDDITSDSPTGDEEQQKPLGSGLGALTMFPKNPDRKTPAGEKVEALIVINNIAGNPEYSAVFVAAHLSPLGDHSKFYQNFSGNAYKRAITPGEQTTIKYSFTPDANAEPMEFALVVRVFIQPKDDVNSTFAIAAYNASLTITEPLGTDPKSVFTVILFGGVIAAAVYWYQSKRPAYRKGEARVVNEVEIARGVKVDADYLPSDHVKHIEKLTSRGRSGSPNK